MTRKPKHRRHFVCRFCDLKDMPVTGRTRLGRRVLVCPGCRGPLT